MIIYKSRQTKSEKVFFIKRWDGALWTIQYFKCKHYIKPILVYYNNAKNVLFKELYSINTALHYFVGYSLSTITYFEMLSKRSFI